MTDRRVMIGDLTRKEFRSRLDGGLLKAAIVPLGSTEQHQDHLAMLHDTMSVAYVAEQAALALYPQIVVATPIPIGVSEHWMEHRGTLTIRPEVFSQYVFDVCDSLRRGGIRSILILNGHGGNIRPIERRMEEFKSLLGINVVFASYWDLHDNAIVGENLANGQCPGHAGEYETSFALAQFPDRVHQEDIDYDDARLASRSKGEALAGDAIRGVVEELRRLLAGPPGAELP